MSPSQRVINIIAGVTECRPGVLPSYTLREQLGCDSLDLVELVMALESEFGIDIDDGAFGKLTTVQEVIDYVTGMLPDGCPEARV